MYIIFAILPLIPSRLFLLFSHTQSDLKITYLLQGCFPTYLKPIMGYVIGNIYVITTVAVTGGALFGFDIASMSAM